MKIDVNNAKSLAERFPGGMNKVGVEFTVGFLDGEDPKSLFDKFDRSGTKYEILRHDKRENEDVFRIKADMDLFVVVSNADVRIMAPLVTPKDSLPDVIQLLIQNDIAFVIEPITDTGLVLLGIPFDTSPMVLADIIAVGRVDKPNL